MTLYSDTEREGIDAKNILKKKIVSHKHKECNGIK